MFSSLYRGAVRYARLDRSNLRYRHLGLDKPLRSFSPSIRGLQDAWSRICRSLNVTVADDVRETGGQFLAGHFVKVKFVIGNRPPKLKVKRKQ